MVWRVAAFSWGGERRDEVEVLADRPGARREVPLRVPHLGGQIPPLRRRTWSRSQVTFCPSTNVQVSPVLRIASSSAISVSTDMQEASPQFRGLARESPRIRATRGPHDSA